MSELFSGPSALQPILVAGCTAVGKTECALHLAGRLNGEVISVDSMQVYRGMDIGTAKPSAAERAKVPHHLLDLLHLSEAFDVARFVVLARKAISEIQGRNRVPILCGGTGLYFKALLEGLAVAPPTDPVLREELEKKPLPELVTELGRLDPEALKQVDLKNPRRVLRAIIIVRTTGRPLAESRVMWNAGNAEQNRLPRCFGLSRSRGDLVSRINVRVDWMFQMGLVEETRELLDQGLNENIVAQQAIGYRQVIEYLRGEHSLNEAIELVKVRTRQFSRRQMTWFRRQLPLTWLEIGEQETGRDAAEGILKELAT
jgi:tRNA dimethylallyltransferase